MKIENRIKLARAIGLLDGCLLIKDMESFNKDGLISSLQEIEQIIEEVLNDK